ncbi:uncharacterized protein BO72DRAFT_381015 [Aspergillus fijiensis CBS 313.89]|uniref:Metallothionein n=1 Tax=Aspergillus fijiensis CBS 313.89 TaxID=1448319 RepID=A0A8G1VWX9_9EURO|nr:uncharacterized protein BO72DRAFT_381015 [Aspergillus fijiensis CBS 313.89]RAK76035.1 hypothetical protein BO72DRAFT_381015 [Aspergillus fijiensis CBS 313.89]
MTCQPRLLNIARLFTGSDHGCSCGASCQCPAGQCKCPVCSPASLSGQMMIYPNLAG